MEFGLKYDLNLEDYVQCPSYEEIVNKDQCVYCYDNSSFPGGVYVCLKSWECFCERHVKHPKKSGFDNLWLNICAHRVTQADNDLENVTVRFEGLSNPAEQLRYDYNLCYVDSGMNLHKHPYIKEDQPKLINDTIDAIVNKSSTQTQMFLLNSCFDGENRSVSKYSDSLEQLPLPPDYVLPPLNQSRCEHCDIRDNLWLNLSDGKVLCGRKYFDGSGGNNHAVEHYKQTNYPLAVKLGTICKTGADVYSYEEDDMVIDLNLEKHLLHFGIDMTTLTVTEKTMCELTLEANKKLEFENDIILENGARLEPASGPGFTGIYNLGNRFNHDPAFIFPDYDPSYWFNPLFQIYKLVHSLESGRYSKGSDNSANPTLYAIKPYALKNALFPKGSIFYGNKQHDVAEFLLLLIQQMEEIQQQVPSSIKEPIDIGHFFKHQVHNFIRKLSSVDGSCENSLNSQEDQTVLLSSEMFFNVVLDTKNAHILPSQNNTSNQVTDISENDRSELNLNFRQTISWETSLNYAFRENCENIDGHGVRCSKTRFRTFPKYLVAVVCRYTFKDNLPVKLDYDVIMPSTINLSSLISDFHGEINSPKNPPKNQIQIDKNSLNQLLSLGFNKNLCENALIKLGSNEVEAAVSWVLENQDNPDAYKPVSTKSADNSLLRNFADPAHIDSIVSMGFGEDMAIKALIIMENNIEAAVSLLLSEENLDSLFEAKRAEIALDDNPKENRTNNIPTALDATYTEGSDVMYHLKGFISHIGRSTDFGHYVCHAIKNNHYYLFNDEMVAKSLNPPKNLGYIYLYERQL